MKAFERIRNFAEYLGEVTRLRARPIVRTSQYDGLHYGEPDLAGRPGIRVASTRWESVWLALDRLSPSDPPPPPADIAGWIEVDSDPSQEPRRLDHIRVSLPAQEAEVFIASGRVAQEDVQMPSEGGGDAGEQKAEVTLRLVAFPELAEKIDHYVDETWRDWAGQEAPKRESIGIYDQIRAYAMGSRSNDDDSGEELVWGVGPLRWEHAKLGAIDHPVIEIPLDIDIEKMSERLSIRPRWQSARLAESFLSLIPGNGLAEFVESERARISELIDAGEKITPFRRQSFEPTLLNCAARIDPVGVYHPERDGHDVMGDEEGVRSQPIVTDGWSLYVRPRIVPEAPQEPESESAAAEDAEMELDAGQKTTSEFVDGDEIEPEFGAAESARAGADGRAADEASSDDKKDGPSPDSGRSEADGGEPDPEAARAEQGGARPRRLPSIDISLVGPSIRKSGSRILSRTTALVVVAALALIGVGIALYRIMPSSEERAAVRQVDTLAAIESSQPSGLSPRGELADYFNLTSRRTADQRAEKEQAIEGEIVQWSLPVHSVKKQQDGIYRVQTSAFMDTVGTVVTLHTRSDGERQLVEELEMGDWITVKGKIGGVASNDVVIVDAIPIAK